MCFKRAIFSCVMAILYTAHGTTIGASFDTKGFQGNSDPFFQFSLDPRMDPEHQQVFWKTLSDAGSEDLAEVPASFQNIYETYFIALFGDQQLQSVLEFVNTNVHILLPPPKKASGISPALASNVGLVAWICEQAGIQKCATFQMGTETQTVQSSTDGVLSLHTPFFDYPWYVRLGILAHEARHSQCPDGLSPAFLQAFAQSYAENNAVVWPQGYGDMSCGHMHLRPCPRGHSLSGLKTCDTHPWGALGISALFFWVMSQLCTTCDANVLHSFALFYSDMIVSQNGPFLLQLLEHKIPPPPSIMENRRQ